MEVENTLPIVPGRGLVTKNATKLRLDFMDEHDLPVEHMGKSTLEVSEIQNNIESFIGSSEIPLGIVGPLKFTDNEKEEIVYGAVGTLEGALVSSMNRGAKVLSLSGGFDAKVHWQKMTRSPLFLFKDESESLVFAEYILDSFEEIKQVTKQYSNHANLLTIDSVVRDENVHLKFVYSTGDASGQNMTTTCTWHAMLYVVDKFKELSGICPVDFVIEGNGASDKKVSQYNIEKGRGIKVTASCFIPEDIITKVLRTTSEKMEKCFHPSVKLAKEEQMVGYNINVANAIASIFVATGQDLASIHESGVGILKLNRVEQGLHLELTLPNLVVGTIGGGTQLPKQAEALKLMGCLGKGKVNRFAKLIAGFALGLEISTYAAIVSGEFAKAHEKLGRNKPVKWLLKSELRQEMLLSSIDSSYDKNEIKEIITGDAELLENGILTNIAGKISKKLIGFVNLQLQFNAGGNTSGISRNLLLKSKALDSEIIKGIHVMAASIDTDLADLIKEYEQHLEYKNSHLKELDMNLYFHQAGHTFMPQYFGRKKISKREVFYFIQEFLDYSKLKIVNSENSPELWDLKDVKSVLKVMSKFHQDSNTKSVPSVQVFEAWKAIPLYDKLLEIVINERADPDNIEALNKIKADMKNWESEAALIQIPTTVIHNDFNSRNTAVRENGNPCVYDWELAVVDFPTRDVVEFLSFVLPVNFSKEEMWKYFDYYTSLYSNTDAKAWRAAFIYSLKTYLATRVSFYEVSGILIKYDFSNRVLNVALLMLKYLQQDE